MFIQLNAYANDPSLIYTSPQKDNFIKYVEKSLFNFCQLVSKKLPLELTAQIINNDCCHEKLEFIRFEHENFPIGVQVNFGILSLFYIQMSYYEINIGFSREKYYLLFQKLAQYNYKNLNKIIANQPELLISVENYICFDAHKIIYDSFSNDLESEILDWLKQYLLLVTLSIPYVDTPIIDKHNSEYSLSQCSKDTGYSKENLDCWVHSINRKAQAILYGSPGTGKTFIAEHLAKHLIGGGDGFLELVQFHPAYTYEDFIQGIRPQSEDGKLTYPLVPGRFLEFCKKAEFCQDTCVLIIDEINRANLAQVLGELMYLLEYRDKEIPLAGGNTFRIPKNVRIIGTMNTADRSIALMDHALRRRFAFIEIRPNYDVLRRYHQKTGLLVERLIKVIQQLNQAIADKNYEIGISFFLTDNLREDIEDIWRMEIEPYLEEYFFNQPEKVENFCWDKIKQSLWI
ncbi:ATPase [Nostoc carneum NIES-2107]|nr:ATPase [Nostoc carneum NIES-2107]